MRRKSKKRAPKKLTTLTRELLRLIDGGTKDKPIVVATAAVIDTIARGEPCIRCQGLVRIEGDEVLASQAGMLRAVQVRCSSCGYARPVYFRVERALLS